ncbi:MAG: prolipoprotein diacylglyceryl transferase [Candidatus Limnocylindrales bacterium]
MPEPFVPIAALVRALAAITWTPDPIAFQLGPLPVYWYGVCYAIGLAVAYVVITREARRRGLNPTLVDNGIIIVGVAALIGGRAYHVIDQWHLYQDDWLRIVLPPYTGLGVYGGILTGTIAAFVITRLWKQSFLRWADVVAPGLFVMQAIGRWGNFFNQELYGPPSNLPWAITIDCAHRITDHGTPQYACPAYAPETTFHPLFLYESVSGILGAIVILWIARRWGPRMRPGDLFLVFLIWYAVIRFALETLRTGNWTLGGIPTAMVVSSALIVGSLAVLAYRHRPSAADGDRWGDPPVPDEDLYDADEDVVEEEEEIVEDEDAQGAVVAVDEADDDRAGDDGALAPDPGDGDPARPAPGA